MSQQLIQQQTLSNGISLLIEQLPAVQSAAVTISMPAGTCWEPAGKNGTAALLSDLLLRGAGDFDSRQLSTAFDNLGVQYSISPGWAHINFSAAMVSDTLPQALELIATVLRQPHLEQDQFQMCKIGREQQLLSIEDEPRQKIMVELRQQIYPPPWNHPLEGTLDHLSAIALDDVITHYQQKCTPANTMIGIAGNVEIEPIQQLCQQLFGDWQGQAHPEIISTESLSMTPHQHHESTQTHIGIAFPAVPYRDPEYYKAWALVSILSGGMSSRLFTKVREERGLCYAIGASLHTLKDRARVLCYAGTTSERAQETLDVTLQELLEYGNEITESELQRCQARAKSSLIMQEESTMARSAAIVRDWFHLGQTTQLEEIRQIIDNLTVADLADYAQAHPADQYQVLTIGPEPLNVPHQADISQV